MALTETRKTDRSKMADAVMYLVSKYGYEATREEKDRYIAISIKTERGLSVAVDFDGDSTQPNVYVLPWHIFQSDAKLSMNFSRVGGVVNKYHFGKCTAVAREFEGLMQSLELAFTMIKSGEAFQ